MIRIALTVASVGACATVASYALETRGVTKPKMGTHMAYLPTGSTQPRGPMDAARTSRTVLRPTSLAELPSYRWSVECGGSAGQRGPKACSREVSTPRAAEAIAIPAGRVGSFLKQ